MIIYKIRLNYINCFKAMNTLTISSNNAHNWVGFLEKLPTNILEEIVEFNPNHRKAMEPTLSLLLRYVYCPSYFNAAEDDISEERENMLLLHNEMYQISNCELCLKKKESNVLLKQIKIGFWFEDGSINPSTDLLFCSKCYNYNKQRKSEQITVSQILDTMAYEQQILRERNRRYNFDFDSDSDTDYSDNEND
jgi:hypothetical protein